MSRFPAQFIDMTIERGLFDHTGALPPVTKLSIELPPEYREKPEFGAVAPYSDGGVDQQVLADIQSAVMREYGGTARRLLNAFRQDVGLGDLSVNGRKAMLGEGVGMSYVSQFGNEAIRIHVSQEGVRKLVGQASDGCMLVVYQAGGQTAVAAIPMKKIDAPTTNDIIYKKKLGLGIDDLFSGGYGATIQAKISNDVHVALCPIHIGLDGVVSVSKTDSNFTKEFYYNTKNSLLKNAEMPGFVGSYNTVLLNWTDRTVFDTLGNKIKFTKDTISVTAASDTSIRADFVTGSGGLYSSGTLYTNGVPIVSGGGWFNSSTASQWASLNSSGPYVYGIWSGPGLNDFHSSQDYQSPPYPSFHDNSYSLTAPYYYLSYSINGGLDKLELNTETGSLTARNRYFGLMDQLQSGDGSMWGLTTSYVDDFLGGHGSVENYKEITLYPIYGFGTGLNDNWVVTHDWYNSNYILYTPFGTILNGTDPWLNFFSANGKTTITGFLYHDSLSYDPIYKIYKNKVDWGDKLVSALGVSGVDQIAFLLLDINLSDIKKLK